jgi:hypothetical protein
MKKTFCDRCGAQCVNTTVMVHIMTLHHTKDNTHVGEDQHDPAEICLNCASEVEAVIPQAFKLLQRDEEHMMAAAPVAAHGIEDYREDRMPR